MVSTSELGMWNLVLFDLPVATKLQRREAQRFRNLLIDLGWSREQYSVYVRYVPTGMSIAPELLEISRRLPRQGVVQVVAVTDRQWSKAFRFVNEVQVEPRTAPEQLTIF